MWFETTISETKLLSFVIGILESFEVAGIINKTSAFDFSNRTINTENLFLVKVQGLIGGVLLLSY